MAGDAFERAADRHQRREESGRRAVGLRSFAAMTAGAAVGLGTALAAGGNGFELDAVLPVAVIFPAATVVMAMLVTRRRLAMSPLWYVGTADGLRVQSAVLRGRAVSRPELAGLAVSTAQYAGARRWMGVVTVLFAFALAWTLGVTLGWVGWILGAAVFVPAALVLAMGMNARRAEAANRALLDC